MSLLAKIFPENPVLTKELRVRMRGARAYWILLGYLTFLAVVLLFTYYTFTGEVLAKGAGGSNSGQVGVILYRTLLVCQIFLVLFITPAITSGSITIEKEQQTIDLLTMTRLSRWSVVTGKMLSAIAFTALLLVSSLPLVSICFMLGSIDPAMVLSTYLEMLCGSFLIGALGLMWSSIAKTTTISVLLTYLTMLAFVIVVGFLYGSQALLTTMGGAGVGSNIAGVAWAALAINLFGSNFMGINSLEGSGFMVMSLLIGMVAIVIAMARLETFPDRRAGLLRLLTSAVVIFLVLSINIWWLNTLYTVNTGPTVKSPAIGVLLIPIGLLMLLIPVFATGELQPYEARKFWKYYFSGWTPKGLNRGKLASGLPFLTLLALGCLAAYVVPFIFFKHFNDVNRSSVLPGMPLSSRIMSGPALPPVTVYPVMGNAYSGTINVNGSQVTYVNGVVTLVNGVRYTPLTQQLKKIPVINRSGLAGIYGDFPQAALVLLTFVIGFALFCQLLSVMFRNRWIAFVLSTLSLLLILILPILNVAAAGGDTPFFTFYVVILDPFIALFLMADPSTLATKDNPLAVFSLPFWFYCSVGWSAIGLSSFLLMLPFVRAESKRNKPIPYEELVAEA